MRKLLILSVFLLFSAAGMAADTLLDFTPAEAQKILQSYDGKKMKARADKLLTRRAPGAPGSSSGKVEPVAYGRFYGVPLIHEMSDLGFIWRLTGEKKYARRGIDGLLGFCRVFPPERKENHLSWYGARSHILYGMALGAWLFENAMTPAEKNELAACGAGYIDVFLKEANDRNNWYYGLHNWNAVVHGPCAMFAKLTADYPGNDRRFAESIKVIKRWINLSIDEKGCFFEGVHYLSYGIDRVLLMAWVVRDRGGEDYFQLPRLKQLSSMLVQKLIPGTMFLDYRGDAGYVKPNSTMLMLAAGQRDPVAAWLWENGDHRDDFPMNELFLRHLPKAKIDFKDYPLAVFFPQRQFSLWRTGWSAEDMLFSIECGPFIYSIDGGKKIDHHRQADKGHFCFYAYGDRWAIDNGYANDHNKENSRGSGFAHSLVSIDGLSEVRGCYPAKGNTFSTGFRDNGRFGCVRNDMTAAYNGPRIDAINSAKVKSAVRQALFARPSDGIPGYAVIFDHIVKDAKPHVWAWNMIFPTDKKVTFRPDGALFSAQNHNGYLKTPAMDQGKAVARFTLKKPGTYRLLAEVATLNLANLQKSDSFYIGVDGGQKVRWDFSSGTDFHFSRWINFEPSIVIRNRRIDHKLELAAGEHTIEIYGREPDAAIRKLVLAPIRKGKLADSFWGAGFLELKLENQGLIEVKPTGKKPNALALRIFCDNMKTVSSKDFFMPPNDMPPEVIGRFSASGKAVNPRFTALLLPLRPEDREPEARCQYTADGVKLTLNWGRISDEITFHQSKQEPEFRRTRL